MGPLTPLLVMGGIALGSALYKRFWHDKLKAAIKKVFDDPKTPEDESASIFAQADGFAQTTLKLAIKTAIEEGMKEARKNKDVDVGLKSAEILVEKYKGSMSLEDAKKLVSEALK